VIAGGPELERKPAARQRKYVVLGLACVALIAAIAVAAMAGSGWFRQKVRARVLSMVEEATGGRADFGDFRFDWKRLRVEVDNFELHGTEPAGKPPLLRAATIAAGLRVLSWTRYDFELQYLEVKSPRIYLIVYPDGRTNLPEPKKKREARAPLEGLVNLAIRRFRIDDGLFEVESRMKAPFSASGRNFDAKFQYERAAHRYRGEVGVQPLELVWNGQRMPVNVALNLALEPNRIAITSSNLSLASSHLSVSGVIDNLLSPHVTLRYQASASLADLPAQLRPPQVSGATIQASGDAAYEAGKYSAAGDWQVREVNFRQGAITVRNAQAAGQLRLEAADVDLSRITLRADAAYGASALPTQGRVASVTVRGSRVDARGIALELLGGTFAGDAALELGKQFSVRGEVQGLEARRAVAVYNPREPLPWNSLLSGSISLDGSFGRSGDLRAGAGLTLAPVPNQTAVSGRLFAVYDGRAGTIDLGNSVLNLPSSRVAVSGQVGRQVRARVETRNFNDFLPVLGPSLHSFPVKLENGSLLFDGTITGKLEDPRIAGRIDLNRISFSGEPVDSLEGTLTLSPESAQLRDASLSRGPLRSRFDATLNLVHWQPSSTSAISARGTVRDANVAEILTRLGQKSVSANGTLNASAQVSGTLGDPRASGQIEVIKGAVSGEAFDRLTANINYDARQIEASAGQLTVGTRRATFDLVFDHSPGVLDAGRLRFSLDTNTLPLDQFVSLAKLQPDLRGTAQVSAKGAIELAHAKARLDSLNADLTAHALVVSGMHFGDTHVTAQTEGGNNKMPVLRVRLDSGVANSAIHGQGEWRLEGDYPGTANIRFSRLDLVELRNWLAPAQSGETAPFQGFAEGEVAVSGPALEPERMKEELRVENFQIGPKGTTVFTLHNAGPLVATAASSVVTIDSAHLTGQSTDLTIGGRVLLNQANSLDLRASGRVDLTLLRTFNTDITSAGQASFEANVRGRAADPQVNGRAEIRDASFSYAALPNSLTNTRGVILFAGNRATIQTLTAETGGGQVQFSGFAGYPAGRALFGLHAETRGVRIRYPEGISTVSNANLDFNGNSDRSTLAGTISVSRATFNVQSDFGSLLAKSAEPVQTPSANTGFVGRLNFDVQIQTTADVQVESSLTQGVQAEANLRLRGTASNPALQGRINIFQGQLVFFGTKYAISEGSVSFYDPSKIEPVLDLDLQTKVRGIDITLTVAGPLNKLTLTPRSDPPLQFNEIVSVLATGSYASDSSFRVQQSSVAQPAQQSAASALLGQAIASPITGRLQRFFGVSGIRIDPTLPGTEYNPQARVTLQQQVTPDVTFTYIANVTQANPQVVSVEWSVNKQWSVVAERDENGMVGLDFFFKKRFK
jgi:translocation and assembly module TamB